jgi:hypothetical protein
MLLTAPLSQELSRIDFELDTCFNHQGVICDHSLIIIFILNIQLLNKVSCIVKSWSSDVAARSFYLVSTLFHFYGVFLNHTVSDVLHVLIQIRCQFIFAKHHEEQFLLPSEIFNCFCRIYRSGLIKITYCDLLYLASAICDDDCLVSTLRWGISIHWIGILKYKNYGTLFIIRGI